jgi:hypothetical protein
MTTATLRHKTKQRMPKPPKMWSVEKVECKLHRLWQKEVENCGVYSAKLEEKKNKLIHKIRYSAASLAQLEELKKRFDGLERKNSYGNPACASLAGQALALAIETRLVWCGMDRAA